MTGAVDSAAPREQPTTQNQCSCRFKQKQLDGWLRGNGEGYEIKKKTKQKTVEQIQKWQREEEEHWELGEGKKKDGNWISLRLGRGEQEGKKKKGEIQAQVQIF